MRAIGYLVALAAMCAALGSQVAGESGGVSSPRVARVARVDGTDYAVHKPRD